MNIDSKDQKMMPTDYTKLEQAARQALAAFEYMEYDGKCVTALREALAEQAEQEQNSMFIEGYRIGLAEMREKCAKSVYDSTDWAHEERDMVLKEAIAAAIRAINFEGDTGFRPVSEMIAEHKQDPKKAAAIEKAKMRKAEQKPVAVVEITYGREPECYVTGNIDDFPEGVFKLYAAPQPVKQEPVAWRVRGYNQFKTGNPAPWRYVDGADKPTVNKPDCCDFEPLYTRPVRTKDLTDEDKLALWKKWNITAAQIDAVIAADREKNK